MTIEKLEQLAQNTSTAEGWSWNEDGELETDDVVVNPPGTVCIPLLAQIDR